MAANKASRAPTIFNHCFHSAILHSDSRAYLGIVAVLHLIVEHVEVRLGHRLLLTVGNRRDVRIVRFFRVSQSEEIAGLDERRHELRVAQCLHARILRVDGMLNRSFPVCVFVHHLYER